MKAKGEVSGGGKKPFKQKGTGRARQGSNTSPLMPGGGRSFGPKPRGYRTDLPLKVLLTAFQRHWRQEQVDGQADASTMARLTAVADLVAAD